MCCGSCPLTVAVCSQRRTVLFACALLGGDGRGDDKSETVEAQGPRCVLLVWDWLPCVWPLVLLLLPLFVLLFFLWGPLLGLSSSHHPFLVPSASCTSSTPAPQLHTYTAYTPIPTLQCDVVLAVIDSLIPHPLPSSHHPSTSLHLGGPLLKTATHCSLPAPHTRRDTILPTDATLFHTRP